MLNRLTPSKNYRILVEQYAQLHKFGVPEEGIPATNIYTGKGVLKHLDAIKNLIRETGANSILDYGAGKGLQYQIPVVDVGLNDKEMLVDYWDVIGVECYDPCYEKFNNMPEGCFDGVIAINVLECIDQEDIEWILTEIFGKANLFVYLSVACYSARKKLPNGQNGHATVKEPEWWNDKIKMVAKEFPDTKWMLAFECLS